MRCGSSFKPRLSQHETFRAPRHNAHTKHEHKLMKRSGREDESTHAHDDDMSVASSLSYAYQQRSQQSDDEERDATVASYMSPLPAMALQSTPRRVDERGIT